MGSRAGDTSCGDPKKSNAIKGVGTLRRTMREGCKMFEKNDRMICTNGPKMGTSEREKDQILLRNGMSWDLQNSWLRNDS